MHKCFIILTAVVALSVGLAASPAGAAWPDAPGALGRAPRVPGKTVTLRAVGRSGVAGQAVFSYDVKTRLTTVRLTVRRLRAGSAHPASVRSGRCGQNGAILSAFHGGVVRAGKNGVATATATLKGPYAGRQLFVIACGSLT